MRIIGHHLQKLESGVGFSKGCDELALKKPPPVRAELLMAICEAAGPTEYGLGGDRLALGVDVRLDQWTVCDGCSVCTTPCESSATARRKIEAGGHRGSTWSCHQKLPSRSDVRRENPRMNADYPAIPTARRDEVLDRETHHLGDVFHGGLTGVGLPVGGWSRN